MFKKSSLLDTGSLTTVNTIKIVYILVALLSLGNG